MAHVNLAYRMISEAKSLGLTVPWTVVDAETLYLVSSLHAEIEKRNAKKKDQKNGR